MVYAKHQSFYIRDRWISKGLKALVESKEGTRFFLEDDAQEKIGLGKNMLEALRYWLIATQLIEDVKDGNKKINKLTDIGWFVYKYDRLLMKKDTVAILHYYLVRNKEDQSTVFNWYFNIFGESTTKRENLLTSFITWVNNHEEKDISSKSIKKDIDCIIQFYTKSAKEDDPEDLIFSPFSKLNLMKELPSEEGHPLIKKNSPELNDIGLTALYYTLLCYAYEHKINLINVDEIIVEKNLWGKVYNLSRNKVIEALNILTSHECFPIEYVRTNNLDNVKLPDVNPIDYLEYEYKELKGNR